MVQSGYSYCSSTSSSPRCLKVKRVRFKPGCTRPSTVQTSRFSFFSRDTILAFAPCNTASTCAMESFQRKPNGGNSSSRACADDPKNQKAIKAVGRIRRTARLRMEKMTLSVFRFVICVRVSAFSIRRTFPQPRWSRKNARARQFGQLAKTRHRTSPSDRRTFGVNWQRGLKLSSLRGEAHFGFSVKKFFWSDKNKIHFFLVDFSGDF